MQKNSIIIYNVSDENFEIFNKELSKKYDLILLNSETEVCNVIKKRDIKLILCEDDIVFIKKIKEFITLKRNYIPIVCITEQIDVETEAEIFNCGADTVIKKPYSGKIIAIKIGSFVRTKLLRDAASLENERKRREIENSRNTLIIAMSILAESRDNSTGEHLIRMQGVTRIIANKFLSLYPESITEKEADEIILFSPLHDIGKIPIPDAVLKNKGIYSEEEMQIMKDHTILGGQLLLKTQEQLNEDSNFLKTAIEIATYHHEKYDGTGYPYGLKGENIPLSARIVSLADVYDAIISPRIYKEGFCHDAVVEIILHGDGRIAPEQFDPKVLYAFSQSLAEIEELYKQS